MRILYVDDDGRTADLVAQLLERRPEPFAVDTTTDPAAGLARIGEEAFDCVVSDLQMPRMDGLDFLDEVRARRPDLPWLLYTNAPEKALDRGVEVARVVPKGDACSELAERILTVTTWEEGTSPLWRSAPSD